MIRLPIYSSELAENLPYLHNYMYHCIASRCLFGAQCLFHIHLAVNKVGGKSRIGTKM